MRARGIEDSKLRHPTTLSQRQGHTPQELNPNFQPTRVCSCPPTEPDHSFPPPYNLCFSRLATQPLKWVPWCQEAAGYRLDMLPVRLRGPANRNPGHSGKGGVHSSRKQWLGEGYELMLHILWIGAHGREGETIQAHPPIQACEHSTALNTALAIRLHTHTLSYLPKIHSRPLHQQFPGHPIVLNPSAPRRETSLPL